MLRAPRLLLLLLVLSAPTYALAQSAASGDFSGLVEVEGRKIYLQCRGTGSPAVILISGYRNNAEILTTPPGPGIVPVFPAIADFTHVCVPMTARERFSMQPTSVAATRCPCHAAPTRSLPSSMRS